MRRDNSISSWNVAQNTSEDSCFVAATSFASGDPDIINLSRDAHNIPVTAYSSSSNSQVSFHTGAGAVRDEVRFSYFTIVTDMFSETACYLNTVASGQHLSSVDLSFYLDTPVYPLATFKYEDVIIATFELKSDEYGNIKQTIDINAVKVTLQFYDKSSGEPDPSQEFIWDLKANVEL